MVILEVLDDPRDLMIALLVLASSILLFAWWSERRRRCEYPDRRVW